MRFYCAADEAPPTPTSPIYQCYGVHYAIDPKTRLGYIQIPRADDAEFPLARQALARGVEGSWFRASGLWEQRVRPQIEAALAAQAQSISV